MFTFSNFKKGLKHQINGTTTTAREFDDEGKKVCVVCGRRIRTGWKYCYEHRHTRVDAQVNSNPDFTGVIAIICISITALLLVYFFISWLSIFTENHLFYGILIILSILIFISLIAIGRERSKKLCLFILKNVKELYSWILRKIKK